MSCFVLEYLLKLFIKVKVLIHARCCYIVIVITVVSVWQYRPIVYVTSSNSLADITVELHVLRLLPTIASAIRFNRIHSKIICYKLTIERKVF